VSEPKRVGLADALEALRSELESAQIESADKNVQFPIERLTVELKVGVTKSAGGKAGFTVPVIGVELGGKAGYDRETLQTITLVLQAPVDQAGNRIKVGSWTPEEKD
jgi:Trypsin-co-occurring domain 2